MNALAASQINKQSNTKQCSSRKKTYACSCSSCSTIRVASAIVLPGFLYTSSRMEFGKKVSRKIIESSQNLHCHWLTTNRKSSQRHNPSKSTFFGASRDQRRISNQNFGSFSFIKLRDFTRRLAFALDSFVFLPTIKRDWTRHVFSSLVAVEPRCLNHSFIYLTNQRIQPCREKWFHLGFVAHLDRVDDTLDFWHRRMVQIGILMDHLHRSKLLGGGQRDRLWLWQTYVLAETAPQKSLSNTAILAGSRLTNDSIFAASGRFQLLPKSTGQKSNLIFENEFRVHHAALELVLRYNESVVMLHLVKFSSDSFLIWFLVMSTEFVMMTGDNMTW